MSTEPDRQQPCTHCGECERACPESLAPQALFFALVRDDFTAARDQRLDACSACNRCVEVCPSHVPLLDWFSWGRAQLAARDAAAALRKRHQARTARLERERSERAAARHEARPATPAALPTQSISHADVLAAIARGRAKVRATVPDRRAADSPPSPDGKHP